MKKLVLLSLLFYSLHGISQNYGQFFTTENLTGPGVLSEPLALAHAPSGKIFIAERRGDIKVFQNGTVSTIFNVQTHIENENGLLGIALHPDFTNEGWLYFFYCAPLPNKFHNIERVYVNANNTIRSREFLFSLDDYLNGAHNGGGMVFKDRHLYIAVGDGNAGVVSQNLDLYRGKILRVTETGQPVASNPYNTPGASVVRQRIWAFGFRNPFRITVDRGTNRLLVADVGTSWEEINDVTTLGTVRNYAWGLTGDGRKNSPTTIDPIYTYATGSAEGCAITNLVGFSPVSTNYPSELVGRLLFVDYCRNELRAIPTNGNITQGTSILLEPELTNNTLGMDLGIDGNLYYVNFQGTGLSRLKYENNQLPVISNQPLSQSVIERDNVTFSVLASGSAPFTYVWRKGGTVVGTNSPKLVLNNVQLANAGNYTVEVRNSLGTVTSNVAILTVKAFNARPVANIILPTNTLIWENGDVINFQGNATDTEDGILPASSFSWELQFNHKDSETTEHYHPAESVSGIKQGTFKLDNLGEKSPNVWFSLILNVVDSKGNKNSDTVEIYPKKINITVNSIPAGLNVFASIREAATPFQIQGVAKGPASLNALSPQTRNGNVYVFSRWEHGGTANQSLTLGSANVTYTAVYTIQSNPTQTPFGGVARNIPGLIQAEDFDNGGQGIAYNDLTVGNSGNGYRTGDNVDIEACSEGGFNLAYVAANEWTEYTVKAAEAGTYNVTLRVATPNIGTRAHLEINGIDITGPINIPTTGGFQTWKSITVTTNTTIALGNQIVRLVMDGNNFNINSITFSKSENSQAPVVAITSPTSNTNFVAPANIVIKATITDNGSISKVEFLNGTTVLNPTNTAGTLRTFNWNAVAAGSYNLRVRATDNSGNVTTSVGVPITVSTAGQVQSPFGGAAKAIPGQIQIEEFDLGGEGISYHDLTVGNSGNAFRTENVDIEACADIGTGFNIGWVQTTEWLEYTVNVANTGNYNLAIRVATPNTGRKMHIEVGGVDISNVINIPFTGGYQTWVTVNVPNIPLIAGIRVLRVVFDGSDFNINRMNFTLNTSAKLDFSDDSTSTSEFVGLYPNPSQNEVNISTNLVKASMVKIQLIDLNDALLFEKSIQGEAGVFDQNIDVSNIKSGIYLVKITTGDQVKTHRLIKQ